MSYCNNKNLIQREIIGFLQCSRGIDSVVTFHLKWLQYHIFELASVDLLFLLLRNEHVNISWESNPGLMKTSLLVYTPKEVLSVR